MTAPSADFPNAQPHDVQPTLRGRNVVLLFNTFNLGGAERQALHLARYLREVCEARVQVWGHADRQGRAATLCTELCIPWRCLPLAPGGARRQVAYLATLARELRRARAEVVLPYLVTQNVAAGLVWKLSGAKFCIWNQRDDGVARVGGKLGHLVERAAVRNTPLFVANSQAGADFLVQALGAPRQRIRVVQNGIELELAAASRAEWRQRLGLDESTFVACMLGALSGYKDHATLLRAWRSVLDQCRGEALPVLLLAGRFDNQTAALQDLAVQLKLGESVRTLGPVSDVAGLLGSVELGVFSSLSEGGPNAVLESMASGLPVVATDIPGTREALGPASQPYLAAPGDAAAFAQHIVTLMRNPALQASVGQANQCRASSAFSVAAMGATMARLIERGLAATEAG